MNGLVLWFNRKAGVGMVWCEDQGPLAFLGPDVALPEGVTMLDCGDELSFSVETRDGVRFLQGLHSVQRGQPGMDPIEILSGWQKQEEPAENAEPAQRLRVVA